MRTHHDMPFGAQITTQGVRFALYAPTAKSVDVALGDKFLPMMRDTDGVYALTVPDVAAGAKYRFRINGDLLVPDPASRAQPDGINADGRVVDPRSFAWQTQGWRGRPWNEAVVYEAHVGTATAQGTFAAFTEKLPDLAALGFTAIQLMPIADCPGERNWGYDGVLLYAPNAAYGTPDDLRAFIDAAHGLGLMVFLDVVYNHFGPSGNYVHSYAETFFTERHPTPWGAGINVDGKTAKNVRAFFVHNALYWIEEFQFDGLRFDAVHAIQDDSKPHILAEIATEIRAKAGDRHVHLILENEHNSARWLERDRANRPVFYTAQWNDDIHHCLHTLLTGETDSYYSDFADDPVRRLTRALAEGFVYQGEESPNLKHARGEPSAHLPPTAFVSFLQNHDQVGNRAFGDRISALTSPEKVAFAHQILLLAPQIPMFFMGEEWGTKQPFLFFVDFASDPELSKAVREGRRREFARFAAYSDPERVPDPTAADTFQQSKLVWDERSRPAHAETLDRTRALLKVRQAEIAPLLASRFLGATASDSPSLIDVTWRFESGDMRLIANPTDEAQQMQSDEGWRLIYGSSASIGPWSCIAAVRSPRGA